MKIHHFVKWSLFLILVLGVSQLSFAGCDQTLTPGADLALAISNTASGTTICLDPGNYGSVNLTDIVKSSDITIRSTPGDSQASVSLIILNSSHLKFQNLIISGLNMWNGRNTDISVLNNTITGQMLVKGSGNNTGQANIRIDSNKFDNISVCSNCAEGGLQIYDGTGVVISNNIFNGGGASDGIQIAGEGSIIGPGNIFNGIIQVGDQRHFDAIQVSGDAANTTISENFFVHNTDCIMAPDGGDSLTIRDNVFVGNGTNSVEIQLGGQDNAIFIHNTVTGMTVGLNNKSVSLTPSSNGLLRDNIFVRGSRFDVSCVNCSFAHNLFDSSSQPFGGDNILGNPTFMSGTVPASWMGHQLISSSLGYKQASDGGDMGANYFGQIKVPNFVGLEYLLRFLRYIPSPIANFACIFEWGAGKDLMDTFQNRIQFDVVTDPTVEKPSHIVAQNPSEGTLVEVGSRIILTVTRNVDARAACAGF